MLHTHTPKILHIYTIKVFYFICLNNTIYQYHNVYICTNILYAYAFKVLNLYKIL